MNSRLMNIEWNNVHRRRVARGSHRSSGNRAEPVGTITRPTVYGVSSSVCLSNGLVERIRCDRVSDSLRSGGRVVDAVSATKHGILGYAPGNADARRPIVLIRP